MILASHYQCIVEINPAPSVVWHWTKTTIDDTPTLGVLDGTRIAVGRQMHRLPHELLEMVISYLIYDTPSLKAYAATCFAWYTVAAPHLHHTLTLKHWNTTAARMDLNPFMTLHKLGLLPLVKKLQFPSDRYISPWVVPELFDSGGLRHFSALVNVQDLMITDLDLSKFTLGVENYFGHFSHTLRSITLLHTGGHLWQLVDFLRLFPKLDDIKLISYRGTIGMDNTPTQRAQIRGSLRGKLTLAYVVDWKLLKGIVDSFGGMRFVSMDLDGVAGAQLLLDACTGTLQTLRFRTGSLPYDCKNLPAEYETTSVLTEPETDSPRLSSDL